MVSLALLLALQPADAATFRLSNFAGLQEALDAVSADGDIVEIDGYASGQGAVSFTRNNAFTIRGTTNGAGWGDGTTVSFNGATAKTITIEDINMDSNTSPSITVGLPNGGGPRMVLTRVVATNHLDRAVEIMADANDTITIDDSRFQQNGDTALYMNGGTLEVYSTEFLDNGSENGTFRGGGLYFDGATLVLGSASIVGQDVVSRGNTFDGNIAIEGGGAFVRVGEGSIDANLFKDNIGNDFSRYDPIFELIGSGVGVTFNGTGLGGGLYVADGGHTGTLDIRWNEIVSNWGWEGAGIHLARPERVEMRNNLMAQNWAIDVAGGLSAVHVAVDLPAERLLVENNTMVGNVSGLTLVLYTIQVVGGGGNARFEGIMPDFRNNIVTHAVYGGGVLGKSTIGGEFDPGDDFNGHFQYNMMYSNCDVFNCSAGGTGEQHLTSNFNQYALHPSNIVDEDPQYIYFGDVREDAVLSDNQAYPDVFCTRFTSLAVGGGDLDLKNEGIATNDSDMGYCGGVQCSIINRDRDGDGFLQHQDCLDDPNVAGAEDTFPGAFEECDFQDNDCDGVIDEGYTNTWWPDTDGDTFGDDSENGELACDSSVLDASINWVDNNEDCDDEDPAVSPKAAEICDTLDNDCDDIVNNELLVGAKLLYVDTDFDGYGSLYVEPSLVCTFPSDATVFFPVTPDGAEASVVAKQLTDNYTATGTDCEPGDPLSYPGAPEVCDDIDHDCDGDKYNVAGGNADEYFIDIDGDSFGEGAVGTGRTTCEPGLLPDPGVGQWVSQGGDCDEANVSINPGIGESCDGIDNDCNGIVDENPVDAPLLYEDFDNDGFGNPATALRSCNPTASYTASVGGDCDDADPNVGECSDCGCQATPTPGSMGLMVTGLLAMFGLRRRRVA